ncbi:MAG: carboxypeptidase-like regulatory domain-containing protein [Candidatus Sulfotelmatobacter sp.]
MSLRRNARGLFLGAGGLIWLCLFVLPYGFPLLALAQSPPPPAVQEEGPGTDAAQGPVVSDGEPQAERQSPGYISGTVIDQGGAVAVGAQVRLTREDQSPAQEVLSGDNGEFSFADVPPGPFQLTFTAAGFKTQQFSGALRPGQAFLVPVTKMAVATVVTEVRVGLSPVEVALIQLKEEEKQRVLGFIPNFYVSYVPDAAPLATKQKYQLAWKSVIDPFTFAGVGVIAGLQQASDDFAGYGQGVEGYAKRFGAAYADVVSGTFIGSAILPSLLKQDPRYFYKGTGSTRSRVLYALANSVICKGDNKRWQPNYSGILGSFATGGISYLYYPANDRDGTQLVLQNTLIRIGEGAFENVLQEFVIRKLTPRLQHHPPPPQP